MPAAPGRAAGWATPPAPPPAQPAGGANKTLPLLLVGGVVLVALVVVGVLLALRQASDGPVAQPTTTVTATVGTGQAGGQTGGQAVDAAQAPTPSPTPARIEMVSTRELCAGPAASFRAFRGNEVTSCEFAHEVRLAYLDASNGIEGPVRLSQVFSPVTSKSYDMRCDFTVPVVCRGGNDAVVYLVPSGGN